MVENTSRLSTTPSRQRPRISSGASSWTIRKASSTSLGGMRQGGADKAVEVGERAGAQSLLPGVPPRVGRRRRKQAEIDIHRLERARPFVDGLDMAAGDVADERPMRGGRRRQGRDFAEPFRRGEAAGEEPDCRRFDVALAAGDLAGKAQPRRRLEAERRVEQFWRIEERVAVQAT